MKYFKLPVIVLITLILLNPPAFVFARTTPDDILNSQKATYAQRVKNYSALHQQKLDQLSKNIAQVNKDEIDYLESLVTKQGEILDEYVRRNNINENGGADGVHRNQDPVSITRIELTRVHEAIAFQAAKTYIINLTSENNIKNDAMNLILNLQSDLNKVKSSTIYSQGLVNKLMK